MARVVALAIYTYRFIAQPAKLSLPTSN